MADVPTFGPVIEPDAPPAEPLAEHVVALVHPRATRSFAPVAGHVDGSDLVLDDVQAVTVYAGGGLPPTRNRGGRSYMGTRRRGNDGHGSGLWRL